MTGLGHRAADRELFVFYPGSQESEQCPNELARPVWSGSGCCSEGQLPNEQKWAALNNNRQKMWFAWHKVEAASFRYALSVLPFKLLYEISCSVDEILSLIVETKPFVGWCP